MRILLVLNKPNRELPTMQAIRHELVSLRPDARVEIKDGCEPDFNRFVLGFRPHVILTYPFTCSGFSRWYYLFKLLCGSRVLCLRAEGVIDLDSPKSVEWAVGYDRHGTGLVDLELFWGWRVAQAVGLQLVEQRRLASPDRLRVVGYPRLEAYFSPNGRSPSLPARVDARLQGASRSATLLFVTGFHLANYTREDLFRAGDLDAARNLDALLASVEGSRRLRDAWIAAVRAAATRHPEALILLKKHPIERPPDYDTLSDLPNVLVVWEDVEVQDLIPSVSLLFHYGSTVLVDAWLARVPSVFLSTSESGTWYKDLGWPSTLRADVSEVPELVGRHLSAGIPLREDPAQARILEEVFGVVPGRPYAPSREIARLLLDPGPPAPLWRDPWLWRNLLTVPSRSVGVRVGRLVTRGLRRGSGDERVSGALVEPR